MPSPTAPVETAPEPRAGPPGRDAKDTGPPAAPPILAVALRRALRSGYDGAALRADVMAGAVVGIVALPLSMALAIATGVPPQHGLYTAVVAGAIVALLGGSKHQVTGPTAAFIVVLAPIVSRHGLSGLLTAGVMAGGILLVMGLARLGRLIEFIPTPVTTGFTAGIATVIATLQLKDAFGLPIARMPDGYVEKIAALWGARGGLSLPDLGVAAVTLALLLLVPRVTRKVPAPLVAIVASSAAVALVQHYVPASSIATIGTRFHATVGGHEVAGIPPIPPPFGAPWGAGPIGLAEVRELCPAAFAIAILGAIESLLSAVIADGMTGKRHDPNAELVALGVGNIVAPFFGGIAATGALARTATNIRSGARSPIAATVHAMVVLLAILVLAPLVAYVPMASLAGLLLLVAWNMSDARHFVHLLRVAPKSDVAVLLTCYVLTVLVDMVASVTVGVVLAALLFMRRMAELTRSRVLAQTQTEDDSYAVPEKVALYEIAGPLFFGAASRAMGAIDAIAADVRVVVLALGAVPVIDGSGLLALETTLERLRAQKRFVIVAGPLPEPRAVFAKAKLDEHHEHVTFADDVEQGLLMAKDLVLLSPEWNAAPPSFAPPR
jgi:sulfate permease, SulP family